MRPARVSSDAAAPPGSNLSAADEPGIRPTVEYLFSCSKESLESFELSRLNRAANLRKELRQVTDEWIQAEAEWRLARWVLEKRRSESPAQMQAGQGVLPFPQSAFAEAQEGPRVAGKNNGRVDGEGKTGEEEINEEGIAAARVQVERARAAETLLARVAPRFALLASETSRCTHRPHRAAT